jgi:hypothetical protein
VTAGSALRHAISACKQQTTDVNEAGQININPNMQRACSPPAMGAVVAAALIAVSNPFFAGALSPPEVLSPASSGVV